MEYSEFEETTKEKEKRALRSIEFAERQFKLTSEAEKRRRLATFGGEGSTMATTAHVLPGHIPLTLADAKRKLTAIETSVGTGGGVCIPSTAVSEKIFFFHSLQRRQDDNLTDELYTHHTQNCY